MALQKGKLLIQLFLNKIVESERAGASQPVLSESAVRRLGPAVDLEAGLVLKLTYTDVHGSALTKTMRAQFADDVSAVIAAAAPKFDLPTDSKYLELYVPTPIDAVLQRDAHRRDVGGGSSG